MSFALLSLTSLRSSSRLSFCLTGEREEERWRLGGDLQTEHKDGCRTGYRDYWGQTLLQLKVINVVHGLFKSVLSGQTLNGPLQAKNKVITENRYGGKEKYCPVFQNCKKRFLTSNASCEEIVSDSCAGLGPDLENESDPSPSACAHAREKLSENASSLQERRKWDHDISSKLGIWAPTHLH